MFHGFSSICCCVYIWKGIDGGESLERATRPGWLTYPHQFYGAYPLTFDISIAAPLDCVPVRLSRLDVWENK